MDKLNSTRESVRMGGLGNGASDTVRGIEAFSIVGVQTGDGHSKNDGMGQDGAEVLP